ncbi:hypothetical protein NUW58_g4167 [Xylaria curta]|uniref:Uncharacterized protein n=1 Tax=Xylaria curta TaxID=42375 RepID=A0ACC1P818_9PEZI|nr:hypothetical protein NUW58_g4167 [Xylaria curta]
MLTKETIKNYWNNAVLLYAHTYRGISPPTRNGSASYIPIDGAELKEHKAILAAFSPNADPWDNVNSISAALEKATHELNDPKHEVSADASQDGEVGEANSCHPSSAEESDSEAVRNTLHESDSETMRESDSDTVSESDSDDENGSHAVQDAPESQASDDELAQAELSDRELFNSPISCQDLSDGASDCNRSAEEDSGDRMLDCETDELAMGGRRNAGRYESGWQASNSINKSEIPPLKNARKRAMERDGDDFRLRKQVKIGQ